MFLQLDVIDVKHERALRHVFFLREREPRCLVVQLMKKYGLMPTAVFDEFEVRVILS